MADAARSPSRCARRAAACATGRAWLGFWSARRTASPASCRTVDASTRQACPQPLDRANHIAHWYHPPDWRIRWAAQDRMKGNPSMITDSHPERALVPPSTFVEADLVVDEPHLRLVAAKLKDLGVTFDQEEIELSRRLGLVLIKNLQGLPDAAAKIKTAADNEKPTIVDKAGPTLAYLLAEATATATAAGSELKNLDVVLVELRRRFKAHFGRWIPEMGKNRHVVSVQAGPGG